MITEDKESKIKTFVDKKKITPDNAEKLLKGIVSRNANRSKAREMYNSIIVEEANTLIKSRVIKNREKKLGSSKKQMIKQMM